MPDGEYHAFIDSEFKDDGELNYAHIIIPSTTGNTKEILISSYLCHPQMANNELSGPAVWSELIRWTSPDTGSMKALGPVNTLAP